PRLQVQSVDQYIDLMSRLTLPNPKMMDVAVPSNMRQGLAQQKIAERGWAGSAEDAKALIDRSDIALIHLPETAEGEQHGVIPGCVPAPPPALQLNTPRGGMISDCAAARGARILFSCACGERPAGAVRAAQDAGLPSPRHIQGGFDAWKKAAGPVARP